MYINLKRPSPMSLRNYLLLFYILFSYSTAFAFEPVRHSSKHSSPLLLSSPTLKEIVRR